MPFNESWKLLLSTISQEAQIDSLFMKIDWASEGAITWDEFCTYMQLEYAEKEDSYKRQKEVDFHLPAKIENIPHRDPVLRITDTPDGNFVACSQVMHNFANLQSSSLLAVFLYLCDKVYQKQKVRFLLYLLGQIVTWQYNPYSLD